MVATGVPKNQQSVLAIHVSEHVAPRRTQHFDLPTNPTPSASRSVLNLSHQKVSAFGEWDLRREKT